MLTTVKCGFSALLLVSMLIVINADQRQKVIDFHSECLDAHGVDEDALIEALDGTVRDDESFYLHLFCAAKKAKIMQEDGSVTLDNFEVDMKDVIDEHNMANVASILRKCLVQKEEILTTIKEAVHCFVKHEHGL
ncbi:uncharacterized protein LOC126742709 [Anthonomus grandis grandis]|uniref:uncharacterized protein LOC126742709 n=1 Tax=Anthonomus grandis grandis TaxID=2921223 RepID=UPI0021651629|nr:uncharacterized protein LOC126742709 [Anthonomus grandis grandis]